MTCETAAPAAVAEALGIAPARVDDELRERYARGVWSCLTEPGDGVAGSLIAVLGAVEALTCVGDDDPDAGLVAGVDAAALRRARARWRPRMGDVRPAFQAARRCGARLITPADPEWPHRVDDLGVHAPVCFWVRGEAAQLAAPHGAVAIVGARAASGYGQDVAMELAAGMSADGVAVVSGAAYGIDGAAHRAALAAGGPTTAVLAGGIDRPYPAGHTDLLDRIAQVGVMAAEVPCGTTPTKWRFLSRNRLIAAMSDATVVVEAGWRSGSLNTAYHAGDLGRPLGAVPGPVTNATSQGCHRLLREAQAVCITGVSDLKELAGYATPDAPASGDGHTDDLTRIRDALSVRTSRSTEDVARRSGMAPAEAGALLALLALEPDVVRDGDGWRRCRVG